MMLLAGNNHKSPTRAPSGSPTDNAGVDSGAQSATPGPKVSVVIPVYNPGEFLHACAESLLNQSLRTTEYEVIFVNDGCTDQSPDYLDALAAEHAFISVIHQANAGGPGQPRNLGTDRARGQYVFYCDADDWLAEDGLERLWSYAAEHHSDVVIGKMAGINRPVPQDVFRTSRPRATLADTPLMDSLTPHKLFRRAFLAENGIRYPEGDRRLEDHYFVVKAYLCAEVISVYADSVFYFHIRRTDTASLGYRPVTWSTYFADLSQAVDLVLERVEPGPLRDRILRRWLRVEMVDRLSGRRFLGLAADEADSLVAAAHELAARSFGRGPAELLPVILRLVASALLAGDSERIRALAIESIRWTLTSCALQASWLAGAVQLTGIASLDDGREPSSEAAKRFRTWTEAALPTAPTVSVYLSERASQARWVVPTAIHGTGMTVAFTATIDPAAAAGGEPLTRGRWDVHVDYSVHGLRQRRRLKMTGSRAGQPPLLCPEADPRPAPVALYLAGSDKGVSLDVGLTVHPRLRSTARPPGPADQPTPPEPAQSPVGKAVATGARTGAKLVLEGRQQVKRARRLARRIRRGLRHRRSRSAPTPDAGARLEPPAATGRKPVPATKPEFTPTSTRGTEPGPKAEPGPDVTVVVAAQQSDSTLLECLRSIQDQSAKSLEILIVGIDPRDRPAVEQFLDHDERIRWIENRTGGRGAELTAAAAAAIGRFIVFVRDTDLLPPRALSRQLQQLRVSGSDFAVGAVDQVRDEGARRPVLSRHLHQRDRRGLTLATDPEMLLDVSLGNVLIATKFWREHGRFRSDLAHPEQPAMASLYLASRRFDVVSLTTCRTRLRTNPDSIVQQRFSATDIDDLRQAADATWALLGPSGAPARDAWLAGLLDTQLGNHLDRAHLGDDGYRQNMADFVTEALGWAGPVVTASIQMHRRVQLWLARERRWSELEELVEWVRLFGTLPPTRVDRTRVLARLPREFGSELPVGLNELSAVQTHFDGCLHEVRWTADGRLLVRGWAIIRGVSMDSAPVHLEARLIEAETGAVLALRPDLEPSPDANRWAHQRYADAADGGFVLLIDPAELPAAAQGAGTTHWQLELSVRLGDLMRTGPLTNALRDGVDLDVPAQNLTDGASGFRWVPIRTPELGFCLQRRRERIRSAELRIEGRTALGVLLVIDPTRPAPLRIRAFIEGQPETGIDAELVAGDGSRLHFELTLPEHRPSGRWEIRAVDAAGRSDWVPWGVEAALGRRISAGDGSLSWQRTTRGFTSLVTDARQLEVSAVTISPEQITLQVRGCGLSTQDLESTVLRGSLSSLPVTSVVPGDGLGDPQEMVEEWTLGFRTCARRWGGPELPLVSGDYTVVVSMPTATGPGRHQMIAVPAESLLGHLPASGLTDTHGWTLVRNPIDKSLVVRLRPPLLEEERSLVGRTRIRDQWAEQEFSARDAVLFQCFRGEFATDSQRALHEELRRRGDRPELLWAVRDHAVALPEGAVPVIIDSREWYDAVGSARYLCQNIDYDRWFFRRSHQRYLQTFHGYPFKAMGVSLWRSQGKSERAIDEEVRRRVDAWDAIVLPDPHTADMYRQEYRYDGAVLVTGYPRDDGLLAPDAAEARTRARELLGLKPETVAVLYAPTWRDTAATGAWTAHMFDELDLDVLTGQLGPDFSVLVRGHNYVLRGGGRATGAEVLDVTSYPEVNDLILAADVAVLDYSSLRFDWLLTEKPCLFFVPDMSSYLTARPSLFPFESTAPGPLLFTTDEVAASLLDLATVDRTYADARRAFNARFQPLNDGLAAVRVVEEFFGLAE